MSLFQAREWWSHKADSAEECGEGLLLVCNIDNDPKGADKIVTGSFSGVLRIYTPKQSGYKVEDLMEFQLDEPILQIEAGRFVGQGTKLSLAVLHPRKLVVYSVVAIGANGKMVSSSGEAASYFDLNKCYEHRLERTAYNMTIGPFGGVYGKDFICVQSMDGQLSFIEQESFAFSRFLPNALVPGPLCYVAKLDAFVTANSEMHIECYKYQVLGASHQAEKKSEEGEDAGGEASSSSSSKRIQVDWSLNLGEHAHSIFVARYSRSLAASQVDILVLGEHTLFTIKENGTIRLQKRLDYNPAAAVSYNNSELAEGEKDVGGANQNLIIATHQHSLQIYKDMQLVWAARTQSVPVAVRVGSFGGVKGFLVTLTDSCEVSVSYLGTDPPLSGVSASESAKELDYEAMDAEHRALLKLIKAASNDSMVEPREKIVLLTQVGQQLSVDDPSDLYYSEPDSSLAPDDEACVRDDASGALVSVLVRVFVQYNGKSDLENVHLSLSFSDAFRCSAGREICIPSVRGSSKTPLILPLRFRHLKGRLPADLGLQLTASYVTANNEPRTARHETQLPLALAAKVIPPLKNCTYMFTLETNRQPPNSNMDTFADVLAPAAAANGEIARTSANVLTLLLWGQNCDVTLLTSQKTGRYRLQSSVFEALNLVTAQLVQRLGAYYESHDQKLAASNVRNDQPPFKVLFKELLPLHDYFTLMDKHFALRVELRHNRGRLERLAHQLRVIQKRLLVRYKDKNPAPLMQLDTLLAETYNQIQDLATGQTQLYSNLESCSSQLSSATHLLLLLIRFKYDLDEASFRLLRSHLTPSVSMFDSSDGVGWEETVDAGCTHLLRTALAKGGAKDALSAVPPNMEPMNDIGKLRRHIQIVCDRLAKGMRLVKPDPKNQKAAAQASAGSARPAPARPVPQQQPQAQPAPPQKRRQESPEALPEEEEEE